MNPKDRMAMMMAGMDGTPDRRAPPAPTEGDNYGYASGAPMPYASDREALHARKIGQVKRLFGGTMAATLPVLSAGTLSLVHPVAGAAGALYGFGTGMEKYYDGNAQYQRAKSQLKGIHPDQENLDADLNAMRYYGHDNLRGPR